MGSIKWKLVLLYIILVVLVIVVSGVYIIINVQRRAYSETYMELEYTSDRIIDTLQTSSLDESTDIQATFADVISALMMESVNMDTKNIYLLTSDGEMKYYRDTALTQADLASRVIMDAMDGRKSEELYVHRVNVDSEAVSVGDYADHFTVRSQNGERVGYILFIRQTMSEVEQTIYSTMIIIVTASVVAILIAGVLAYFLAGTISGPLRRLTRRTQEMAKGNLEAGEDRNAERTRGNRDELTELESNFTYMGRELSSMLREVNNEKNKLATVFTYMADGLVVYDTDGKMIQSNPAASRLMGDRILYQDFNTIFAPHRIEEILSSNEKTHSALMQVDEAYINAIFVEYMQEEDSSAGLIVVLQDTTEQKQMEEMQREFVANVSHELRTPITTIKSYVETLMDGAKDEPEIEDRFLSVINVESDRMTHLISELLELSRIDSRQVKLTLQPVNITEIVETSVIEHQILAEKKQQILTFDGPSEPCYIMADRGRIEQVLRNLITNAVKYSPEKARINLGLHKTVGRVEVYVKDTGFGIEKKEQERIFERFYRVDKARSRSMGGTGLGLAIAREIMEMHHGNLWVESEYGKGSTFWLGFPSIEAPEKEGGAA